MREPVKGTSEAGRRREQRAQRTRQRIVDAALVLFLERGYAGTTVDAIAQQAQVAPATVYQAFGTKRAILARALDVAIAGDSDAVGVLERPWVEQARAEPDAGRRLETIVSNTAKIAARSAAMKAVMRDAAATEPGVRDLLREDHQRRFRTQRALVEMVLEAADRGPTVDREHAVATFFALVNSDGYQLVADHLGWDVQTWAHWLTGILRRLLLEPTDQPERREARVPSQRFTEP